METAQNRAVRSETLTDGRIRYYSKETPSSAPGPTRGSAYVTEYNPQTGQVRSWQECYTHSGEVNRIHPKNIDGQILDSQHYPPTASEIKLGAKQ